MKSETWYLWRNWEHELERRGRCGHRGGKLGAEQSWVITRSRVQPWKQVTDSEGVLGVEGTKELRGQGSRCQFCPSQWQDRGWSAGQGARGQSLREVGKWPGIYGWPCQGRMEGYRWVACTAKAQGFHGGTEGGQGDKERLQCWCRQRRRMWDPPFQSPRTGAPCCSLTSPELTR